MKKILSLLSALLFAVLMYAQPPEEGHPPLYSFGVNFPNGNLDFGNQYIGASEVKSYELAVSGFNAGGDDVLITAPYPFKVSLSQSSGFTDTLTITGGLSSASVTIYVTMDGDQPGVYNNLNIRNGSASAANVNAPVSGTLVTTPGVIIPAYTIDQINGLDANGEADSSGVFMALSGVVYSQSFRSPGLQFAMMDGTGGIDVFSFANISSYPTVTLGDSITVYGELDQYNGLLEIIPDSIKLHKQNADMQAAEVVTSLNEYTESRLVKMESVYLTDPAQWTNSGSAFNVNISNGTDTFEVRVYASTDLFGTAAPETYFNITGIGWQFDGTSPYDGGYQLVPRSQSDLEILSPELHFTPDTIDFGSIQQGDSSGIFSYAIEGKYLFEELQITSPAEYDISLDSNSFSNYSITIVPNALGRIEDTVYVRFISQTRGNSFDSIAHVSDTALSVYVTGSVLGEQYPSYSISQINGMNADGETDSVNVNCTLNGIVYGTNLRPSGLQFVMRDQTGGITVFNASGTLGYQLQEGDSIEVKGEINQYNGLLQIAPVQITAIATGKSLKNPDIVTALGETTENDLIKIEKVFLKAPSQWTNSGSGFNVEISDGVNDYVMRIDADINIFGEPAPEGYFDITGLGTQFDASSPYDEGYQILPRYINDISEYESSLETTPGSVLDFGNVDQEDTSASQYFVLRGEFITSGVSVTTSEEFPISLGATSGFTDSLYISAVPGDTVLTDTIYVKFAPSSIASFNDSVISIAGNIRQSVEVKGNGIEMYPSYRIAQINSTDPNGEADSVDVSCRLHGVVYGVNLRSSGLQFTLIDGPAGITVFSFDDFGYTVQEGDSISVEGTISQYNGLLQIEPNTLEYIASGRTLQAAARITVLDESTENRLIRIDSVQLVDSTQWQVSGGSFNIDITDGTNTYVMRIHENIDLYGKPAPSGTFDVTGIGTQFDQNIPYNGGYQIMPRYEPDILERTSGIGEFKGANDMFSIFPNPVNNGILYVRSDAGFTEKINLQIYTLSGVLILTEDIYPSATDHHSIDVNTFPAGSYILIIESGKRTESKKFIVEGE